MQLGYQSLSSSTVVSFPGSDLVNNSTETLWLTSREAGSYLKKVEARTILMWARQGKVKGYVLSGIRRQTWRFLHSDLDAMLLMPSVALTKRRIQ